MNEGVTDVTTTIPQWLLKRANLTPETTAIQLADGTAYSFATLYHDAVRKAEQLKQIGINKGDHIAVLSRNSYDMVTTIHALTFLKAVAVLLNTRLTAEELTFQITDADCTILLYDDTFRDLVEQINFRKSIHTYSFIEMKQLQGHQVTFEEELELDDTVTIMYTSGTTGKPKGVQLTYGNHWWSAISSSLNLGLHREDRWLAALPLFHVGGFSILIRSVIYGIPIHLHEKFSANQVHQEIMNNEVTTVSVVSTMLEGLLQELGDRTYPETFRCMLLGGGPASQSMLERCAKKGVPVYQTYGMTETSSQVVTIREEDALRKLGSAGKPLFPVQLRIVKNNVVVPTGVAGEIIVKGPMVTKGYYKREETNRKSIENGWLKTGDVGYVDEEGFLYVLDRQKDLIISGGENVYPAEVEGVLKTIPGILDAGVIGKSDDKWGQIPVAFIVKNNTGLTVDQIVESCKGRLAKYKVPKEVYFVDELPRNASRKILRRKLYQLLKP
ncbi:o-succinylbenzoate--CoA ligase [Salirhabdus salicampi]|uniref:o-succinylbenzoate--CoA ligase n=1 Tax=Salirhabdus salicampi TaxID=476102 RepID=UPI0020C3A58E|nr:o-succinylbenzoate--CoA ligase [Salirhabdus salicampi]MCP8617790.1 o-succinylbenzoate--CoA ligase [Salirhabdus salicampi]